MMKALSRAKEEEEEEKGREVQVGGMIAGTRMKEGRRNEM